MRLNVYSQELTNEIELVEQIANTGVKYHAVRLILHSSEKLHHPLKDDDRSAITFWLPKSNKRRCELIDTFRNMAELVRDAPLESGLD